MQPRPCAVRRVALPGCALKRASTAPRPPGQRQRGADSSARSSSPAAATHRRRPPERAEQPARRSPAGRPWPPPAVTAADRHHHPQRRDRAPSGLPSRLARGAKKPPEGGCSARPIRGRDYFFISEAQVAAFLRPQQRLGGATGNAAQQSRSDGRQPRRQWQQPRRPHQAAVAATARSRGGRSRCGLFPSCRKRPGQQRQPKRPTRATCS